MRTTFEVTTENELSDRQIADVCVSLADSLKALVTGKVTGQVAIHVEPGQSAEDALKRRDDDVDRFENNVEEFQSMIASL